MQKLFSGSLNCNSNVMHYFELIFAIFYDEIPESKILLGRDQGYVKNFISWISFQMYSFSLPFFHFFFFKVEIRFLADLFGLGHKCFGGCRKRNLLQRCPQFEKPQQTFSFCIFFRADFIQYNLVRKTNYRTLNYAVCYFSLKILHVLRTRRI